MSKRKNNEHWSLYTKKYFMELVNEEQSSYISDIPEYSTIASNSICCDVPEEVVDSGDENQLAHFSDEAWEELLTEIEKSFEYDCVADCAGNHSSTL